MGQVRGSGSYRREVAFPEGITLKSRPLFSSQFPIDKWVETPIL
jgi:hypothetical protein